MKLAEGSFTHWNFPLYSYETFLRLNEAETFKWCVHTPEGFKFCTDKESATLEAFFEEAQ
jgi:hypothetical protein